jgi:hypothetical protein
MTTAVENVEASQLRDDGQDPDVGFHQTERRGRVRHLVVFPAQLVGAGRPS